MRITKIERQKKAHNRYSVYVDGRFSFGVRDSDLLNLNLKVGQNLDEEKLNQFHMEAELGKAYERSLSYLDIRSRSEKEVTDYLTRKKYSRQVIKRVIDKLKDVNLIDDSQFSKDWVSWRQNTTTYSRKRLAQELRQKGIDQMYIKEALATVGAEEELNKVKEVITKKGKRYNSKQKLIAYLARQGYSYDTIRQAMENKSQQD